MGEVMAEQAQRDFRVIRDEKLNARLQQVGGAILKRLPESGLKYQFTLVDLPSINAFGIAGGRVYVTRKIVAFLQSDEELAALLAHEIGHIYTHQQAIDFSRLLFDNLGVDSVGDRENIRKLYNELLNKWRLKAGSFDERRSAKEQIVADRVALYALARAGYPPEVMPAFFDRLAETHGKTGGFLSDLFGITSEDDRRLRELLKSMSALPPGCKDQTVAVPGPTFQSWQQAVIAYSSSGSETAEVASEVIRKTVLEPPLQDDFRQIRFSPDGKSLLVQDDAGITVLARDPFAVLFHIPAPEATPAGFSPDSSSVVFYTTGLRVERWSIAEKKQVSVKELLERRPCLQSALSPDGNTFVCFDEETALRVIDVSSGKTVFEKKDFAVLDTAKIVLLVLAGRDLRWLNFVNLDFTPDSKVMVAASVNNFVALDLTSGKPVPVPASTRTHFEYPAAFLAPDRFAVAEGSHSGIYGFPSGSLLSKVDLAGRSLQHAAGSDVVMVRPLSKYAVGAYDLKRQKMLIASSKSAIDCYGDIFATETREGKLALVHANGVEQEVLASIDLPRTELRSLDAVATSADMNWLAFSLHDRGAVYDLQSHRRAMLLLGFRGVHFVSGPAILADYPKKDETPRTIAKIDLRNDSGAAARTLPDDLYASQVGGYLVVRKPATPKGSLLSNVTVEVQDIVSGQPLFTQKFPGTAPKLFMDAQSGLVVFVSGVSEREALKGPTEQISAKFSWPNEKKSVYQIQVVNISTGKKVQDFHIDSGKFSFAIRDLQATPDFLALTDSENRVQLYSMATGKQIGVVFGGPMNLSTSGLLAVLTEKGRIALYECAGLKKLKEFELPSAAIYVRLSNDGKRLLVLTADQTAYLLRAETQTTEATATSVSH